MDGSMDGITTIHHETGRDRTFFWQNRCLRSFPSRKKTFRKTLLFIVSAHRWRKNDSTFSKLIVMSKDFFAKINVFFETVTFCDQIIKGENDTFLYLFPSKVLRLSLFVIRLSMVKMTLFFTFSQVKFWDCHFLWSH